METSIQHLFIVRHGHPFHKIGVQQSQKLCSAIRDRIGDSQCAILTSTVDQAQDTALVLQDGLSAPTVIGVEDLWDDDKHAGHANLATVRILECTTPVVVVVTHYDLVPQLTHLLSAHFLSITQHWEPPETAKGWHINLVDRTITPV